jgi:hypothetical protein
MNIPRIQSAAARDGHLLFVTFTDGSRKRYDVTRLLDREMFALLKAPGFFSNVAVEPGGYAVFWGPDIDISEYELWKNGEAVSAS